MAESNALPLVLLAEQFAKLPGIGMKSAQRLAYYVMSMTDEDASALQRLSLMPTKAFIFAAFARTLLTSQSVLFVPTQDVTTQRSA